MVILEGPDPPHLHSMRLSPRGMVHCRNVEVSPLYGRHVAVPWIQWAHNMVGLGCDSLIRQTTGQDSSDKQ